MGPRDLCDVTLDADKAVLPCTQEMSSDWGQGQLQEELPGINGALDLGCQTTSGTSRVLRRAIFVPRVNQSFAQDLGSCLTLAKFRDLSASGTSHDVTEAEIHPGRTQMKRQCFQPGRKRFRIWGCRNKSVHPTAGPPL